MGHAVQANYHYSRKVNQLRYAKLRQATLGGIITELSQQTQYQVLLVITLAVVGVLGYFNVLNVTITTALIPSIVTVIITLPVKLSSEAGSGITLANFTRQGPALLPKEHPDATIPEQ